ncbi:flagellar hook-length control protein FliK [Polaromonas sp. LjRoot131]|uniref:flagellar hook-length control protein FliK n=1 Tax=Polaromonas sp. LjRoot131 TaxID=3342262 RepID=UPI003ED080A6
MSLLPPTLSAPAPAPTGNASSASSAASSRGDEAAQGDGDSFGDVLSRSLAASGEALAKAGGKPAASVPVKRIIDDKKSDAPEAINTAALLFMPLETRMAKAAGAEAGTAAAAGGSAAAPLSVTAAAEASTAAAAPAAATVAANDATLAGDAEAAAPQALLAAGAPLAPTKDRGPVSAPTALASAADEAALDLPAGKTIAPAAASDAGQAKQFSAHDERPGGEAREIPGTDTRVEQKPGAPKAPAMAAANDAAGPATANVSAAPAAASQVAATDAPSAAQGFTIGTASAPAHGHAQAAGQPAAPLPSQAALTPEVGSGEWGQALGRQMLHMGKAGEQVAELQLNPPGLGPLKVTLSLNDNQVQAMFVSAHASVRAAVEAALPQLRSTLADNGISLGDTSVNSGSQQQPAFAQGQDGRPGQSGAQSQRTQPGYLPADAAAPAPTAAAPVHPRGKVDTYA